jgi:hypothetical protein
MAVGQSQSKLVKGVLLAVLVVLVGGTTWYVVHSKHSTEATLQTINNSSNQASKTTRKAGTSPATTNPTTQQPAALDKSIESYKAVNLYQKCEVNDLTDNGTWGDSTPSVAHYDFNSDDIEDVLVYAKIPGTMGYSRGCVFTVKAGALAQLWRLNDADLLPQSDITLNDKGQVVYNGKQETSSGIQDTVVYYQWSNVHNTLDPQD